MANLIDFKAVHGAIKDELKTKGLTYHNASKWFNYKMGVFPEASHGNGYTIMPGPANKTEEFEAYDWFEPRWTIEFCLKGENDLYLSKMSAAYTAVKSLESITADNIVSVECIGWDVQNVGSNVIVTFDLMITINEK